MVTGGISGVVLARRGGAYRVRAGDTTVEATLRGRLKLDHTGGVLVGDEVELARHPGGAVTIERVLPRRSLLQRRMPGKRRGVRAIAANIDQAVVVGAAEAPAWDSLLMDRFLAVVAANRLPALLLVNKCDLAPDAARRVALLYRSAGYTVLETSARAGHGLADLAGRLEGRVSVFTGPTGVGKSSLLNALKPGLGLRTRAVSARSRAGRHTTVAAEMVPFGRSGYVVDTPGLHDVGLWGLDPQEVEAAFPDVARFACDCRFDNCRHFEEPECAVRAACERGDVAPTRLASYRQLLAEAIEASRPWSRSREP